MNLLVTATPGSGKTTLVERLVTRLKGKLRISGFTTSEVRDQAGRRIGFDILTTGGRRGTLARVGLSSPVRVGRYGVALEDLERLALPEIGKRDVDLIVVDEIGKMEVASALFREAVRDALDAPVNVLATIGVARSPFFDSIRSRKDVELLTLTLKNRDALADNLLTRLLWGSGTHI